MFSDDIDVTFQVQFVSLREHIQGVIISNDRKAPLNDYYFEDYNNTLWEHRTVEEKLLKRNELLRSNALKSKEMNTKSRENPILYH